MFGGVVCCFKTTYGAFTSLKTVEKMNIFELLIYLLTKTNEELSYTADNVLVWMTYKLLYIVKNFQCANFSVLDCDKLLIIKYQSHTQPVFV